MLHDDIAKAIRRGHCTSPSFTKIKISDSFSCSSAGDVSERGKERASFNALNFSPVTKPNYFNSEALKAQPDIDTNADEPSPEEQISANKKLTRGNVCYVTYKYCYFFNVNCCRLAHLTVLSEHNIVRMSIGNAKNISGNTVPSTGHQKLIQCSSEAVFRHKSST